MRQLCSHRCVRPAIAAVMAVAASACGASAITEAKVEASVANTFANLVDAQLTRIGLRSVTASDITVKATCHRPAGGDRGAGEWVCALVWSGPNRTILQDTFDLTVGPDGCYTAAVDPTESQLGGPTITSVDGKTERNLLYRFDGCFDIT